MPINFADQVTPGGYAKGEVASALQKEIRRGNEREALFWASELDLAGNGEYVWKRLRIIASEDVGLADNEATVLVAALYEHWKVVRGRHTDETFASFHRVFIFHAVCYLARAPKSRMLDHALMTMYEGERPVLEVPEYALDKHTRRGRRMGRGMEHFLNESSRLENEAGLHDPYKQEGQARILEAAARKGRA
jgi:replication-associated recombination protein RarA